MADEAALLEQETKRARREATSAANVLFHILNPATTVKVCTLQQAQTWFELMKINVNVGGGRSRWAQVQVTHKNEYDAYVAAMQKLRDKETREYDAMVMLLTTDKLCRSIRL